jgi:hypothetical protein
LAISEQRSIWRSAPLAGDAEATFAAGLRRSADDDQVLAHEPQWGRWKVTLVVVLFCAAFWSGIGYIATRLLS